MTNGFICRNARRLQVLWIPPEGQELEVTGQERADERRAMVRAVEADAATTADWLGKPSLDPKVMAAMERVPRHRFIPEKSQDLAYANRPLRIGHGQTISQPFIVAVMSELAAIRSGERVLEIGTGCGYQSAVLAELGAKVFSIERISELAASAEKRLIELGYGEVIQFRIGDGAKGWPEQAPFDAIVVTATTNPAVVAELAKQLVPGGRLVVPEEVASDGGDLRDGVFKLARWLSDGPETDLCLITKDQDGACDHKRLLPVAFVPLIEGEPEN